MEAIHIGQLIEKRIKELHISKTQLASRIGTSRQNIWMIATRKSIQVDLLVQLCYALNYDFFQHYALKNNDMIKQEMQLLIDKKEEEKKPLQDEIAKLKEQLNDKQKQIEDAVKIIEEKNFLIEVLRGKK